MHKEEWKPIACYEGLYFVGNKGSVKNRHGRILKQDINRGYARVELRKNDIPHKYLVHRLVAEAFIPNPLNLPCVNH